MKYNYVIFNSYGGKIGYKEDEDYYVICLKDLEGRDDVIINNYPLQDFSSLLLLLFRIHTHDVIGKFFRFIKKSYWYPYVFRNTFKDDKPICFVCLRYPPVEYLKYLKSKYTNCKIVKLSRDLISTQKHLYDEYSQAKIFDLWMSYDKNDCAQYGFPHFDEFESKIDIPIGKNYPISDVFFVGRAKNRLKLILDIYDKLTQGGIKCLFYIVGAKDGEKAEREGVIYSEKPMTYKEMLEMTVNSRCLLDINQKNAVGYTSRFLEAVMFNKMLITNCDSVKDCKYYDSKYIQIINSAEDVNVSLLNDDKVVDYHYDGEFSPVKRIELVDSLL